MHKKKKTLEKNATNHIHFQGYLKQVFMLGFDMPEYVSRPVNCTNLQEKLDAKIYTNIFISMEQNYTSQSSLQPLFNPLA